MAGLGRQDLDFWNFVKGFDYIGLGETWLNEKGWNDLKNRLPKSHSWVCRQVEKEKGVGLVEG